MTEESIEVVCYAGYKGDESPTALRFGDRTLLVKEIIDRWYDPDCDYFKVLLEDDAHYLLRHDLNEDVWEVAQSGQKEA